jgi:hypothetical protein
MSCRKGKKEPGAARSEDRTVRALGRPLNPLKRVI